MNPSMHMNMAAPPPFYGHRPRPGLIVAMILGFVFFWPVGLGLLAYMIWSKRMGCGFGNSNWAQARQARWEHKMSRLREKMERWGCGPRGEYGFAPTGNRAFDEYRAETIRRLEDEAQEFRDFLDRLRHAKDKAEFDDFMKERRNAPPAPREEPNTPPAN